ncbi:MAG TPA: FAD-dependent oxidoreductase [Candidatus Didemnitutus sp.]|nr:FAD-dependent oxidoreductase [Candidatus Didemnitutus sp.]
MNTPLWDDAPGPELPRLSGTQRADVVVVGLGGSGLSALEELQRQGVEAVGIDAGVVGGGAAGRNGGFVLAGLAKFYHDTVKQLGRELAAALYRETELEIARWISEWPQVVRRTGSLRIAADEEEVEDCRRHLAALHADDFGGSWYEGAEGTGLLLPTDAVMQPLTRVRALAQRLRNAGVRLYQGSPVRRLLTGQVVTDAAVIHCDAIVVAVDGRLDVILPELAGRVRTARLQMLATAPAPEVTIPRPVYWRHGFEYWQQRPDGCVALGGFRDHALEQEWTVDAAPTEFIQGLLEKFLREHLHVRAPVTHRWAASVGYTPDGLPILEEVRPGIWAVGGYNGTGNIVGALSARAAAARAVGGRSEWGELLARARR